MSTSARKRADPTMDFRTVVDSLRRRGDEDDEEGGLDADAMVRQRVALESLDAGDAGPRRAKKAPRSPGLAGRQEAAREGLPTLSSINWAEAQLWDHGEVVCRGVTRFNLKLVYTDRPPYYVNRKRGNATRYVALSAVESFRANVLRRRKTMQEWERDILEEAIALARQQDAERVEGQPGALLGLVTVKVPGLGTQRYAGQFAIVRWKWAADEWLPEVDVFKADEDGGCDSLHITMKRPKDTTKAGALRSGKASDFVGTHLSATFRAYLQKLSDKKTEATQ
jgi:hypothetical protein